MEKTIKKVAELRKDRVDLETKFILGMEDILDPNQMVKLSVFKQRLMKEIQGEMRLYDCEQSAQDDLLDTGQDVEYNDDDKTTKKFAEFKF